MGVNIFSQLNYSNGLMALALTHMNLEPSEIHSICELLQLNNKTSAQRIKSMSKSNMSNSVSGSQNGSFKRLGGMTPNADRLGEYFVVYLRCILIFLK